MKVPILPYNTAVKSSFLPAAHWSFLTPYYEALARPFAHRIWKRITDEVVQRAPHSAVIADLGCGPGTVLRLISMRRPDLRLHGIDIDPEIINIAQKKNEHGSMTYDVAPITDLPFADASVDIVLSSLVFHHLTAETQRVAMKEIRRVLKPGGTFLLCDFSVPRKKWLMPIAALVLRIEASAPLQIRGQLFTLAKENKSTIETMWSAYGCISLHVVIFPQ